MIIIGCDYHPGFQQIAYVDTETGDYGEPRLEHSEGAEKFYRDLAAQGKKVRVGMEASGHARWFERLLGELNMELWIGDASEIARKRERKQKTDLEDARHILQLLMENRFPKIWVPSGENRDLRQLLWHRHRMVQMRTRIMNQLQAVARNEGLRCKKRLWRQHGREQLESFRLSPWASRRREDLLQLLDRLNPTIAELTQAIEQAAREFLPLRHSVLPVQNLRSFSAETSGRCPYFAIVSSITGLENGLPGTLRQNIPVFL
jgi:transposase